MSASKRREVGTRRKKRPPRASVTARARSSSAPATWINQLRLWTQELYLACLAHSFLPNAAEGSCLVAQQVRNYRVFRADPEAPPSLRNHPTRDTSKLSLRAPDYELATARFSQRLASSLLLDLAILQDSALRELLAERQLHSSGGIEAYIAQLTPDLSELSWA